MSKSLGRLDVVHDVKTDLSTQRSALTFKPGKPIDFHALADAVDKAGFTAGSITIWAKGTLSAPPDGGVIFTVSGSNQTFLVADSPEVTRLKREAGKEIPLVGKVLFTEMPPRLILGAEAEKAGSQGTQGMGEMKGMGK
ncbi:MAG: heavy-metal-associated domain-containing protein [candidate division NC10 bacterium]|nr:heavy-metal-associated domain-containing protein [candidate division NC10 bacterium]